MNTTKEPWRMTRGGFSRDALKQTFSMGIVEMKDGSNRTFDSLSDKEAIQLADMYFLKPTGVHDHEYFVQQALAEGKPIPAEVLKDYPGMEAVK